MNRSLTLLGLLIVAGLGAGAWWLTHGGTIPGTAKVGAGQPLNESSSQIKVLEEAQPVTTSAENLNSEAAISAPVAPAPRPQTPAVFDKTAAQLGTTISLLLGAWPSGGPLPRQLAADAATLADATGQLILADAAAALRSATPREGPTTLNLLLVEAAQAVALPAPEDLPADNVAAEAQKSWLRKELEQLVSIRSTPDTQTAWSSSLGAVQQMIARGLVVDALDTLKSSPLASDDRLNQLREDCKVYLSQTGKLNNLVTAYTSTFTTNPNVQ